MAETRERNSRPRATKTQVGDVVALSTVHELEVSADDVVGAVTDFSPRRALIFPAVSARRLKVHALGPTTADATEGTRVGPFTAWERCTYDWSRPGIVTATVTDSNVYAVPDSSWTLAATPTAQGCRVEMTWQRRFRRRGLGRFMGVAYRRLGERSFAKYASDIVANIERAAVAVISPS